MSTVIRGNDNFDTAEAYVFEYTEASNPLETTNPPSVGARWKNDTTGEIFACILNTTDLNCWVGDFGTKVGYQEIAKSTANVDASGYYGANVPIRAFDDDSGTSWLAQDYAAATDTWIRKDALTDQIRKITFHQPNTWHWDSMIVEQDSGGSWASIGSFSTTQGDNTLILNSYSPSGSHGVRLRGLTDTGVSTLPTDISEIELYKQERLNG